MSPRNGNGITRTITIVGGILGALAIVIGGMSAFYMTRADAATIHETMAKDAAEERADHANLTGHPVIVERVRNMQAQVEETNRIVKNIARKLRVEE